MGLPIVAELVFFSGTMDLREVDPRPADGSQPPRTGPGGLIFTRFDRAGQSVLSSRLGLSTPAVEVSDGLDLWDVVVERRTGGTASTM